MNILPPQKLSQQAVTFLELLIIIAIICIMAGLLMPANGGREKARIHLAIFEMHSLTAAIDSYKTAYSQLPLADLNTNDDVTFGFNPPDSKQFQKVLGTCLVTNNSDVIIILMDIDQGVNAGHKMNPQRHAYLEPRMAKDAKSMGVSTNDYQYRDPWGNPYIISLDANRDGWTRDALYSSPVVSSKQLDGPLKDNDGAYEAAGGIMIWSRGPDGKADPNIPANAGVNKDNITSWQSW